MPSMLEKMFGKFIVFYVDSEGKYIPCDPQGEILLKSEWEELRTKTDLSYESETDGSISEYNDYLHEEREKAHETRRSFQSKRSIDRSGFVYIAESGGVYKIGMTKNPQKRMSQISPLLPHPINIIHVREVDDCSRAESFLHEKYASKRLNGEWFALSEDDIKDIREFL